MSRGRIVGCITVVLLLLGVVPRSLASQSEIDAILTQLDAGFHQTFDGSTLRPWQEAYQAACVTGIPRLAGLLQEEGMELTHNPYEQHRDLLRQTLPKMQDKSMQAMDLNVQIGQKLLAVPGDSAQANALRAQMSEQEKTVKLYETIIATLQERLTYLDKCVPYAAKAFADAARARRSLAANHPAPSPPPSAIPDAGGTVAMPTGVTADSGYDPKKGLSIGCVASQDANCSNSVTPATPPSSGSASGTVSDADLRQAAQACKERYEQAYERLRQKRRQTIEQAKQEIPKLEACISDKAQIEDYWRQRRKAPASNETLEQLRRERDDWQAKANRMEDQAAKNDAYRKWEEATQEVAQLEQNISKQEDRRLQLIDETIRETELQKVNCEVTLQLLREKIATAEKAMGDSLEREIAAHRQKRYAEIDLFVASRNLPVLQACAAQGYLGLDDLMKEIYK